MEGEGGELGGGDRKKKGIKHYLLKERHTEQEVGRIDFETQL